MIRSLLRLAAAVAVAALVAPPSGGAAPAPGLAYDEIVRVVVGGAPPPPDGFAADAAALAAATPNPAPRRRRGSPGPDAATTEVEAGLGPAFAELAAAARAYLQPRLLHYAYWNGWERIDDSAMHTATIRKCDVGQTIVLDLAAKTYRIRDPAADTPDTAASGTAVATIAESTAPLPVRAIEGLTANGYRTTATYALTEPTGSCRAASGTIEATSYLAGAVTRPTAAFCPIRRPPLPETSEQALIPHTGCRPTYRLTRTGPTPPSSRLPLWSGVRMGPVDLVTERGNLRPLGSADAAAFAVPSDFTPAP